MLCEKPNIVQVLLLCINLPGTEFNACEQNLKTITLTLFTSTSVTYLWPCSYYLNDPNTIVHKKQHQGQGHSAQGHPKVISSCTV